MTVGAGRAAPFLHPRVGPVPDALVHRLATPPTGRHAGGRGQQRPRRQGRCPVRPGQKTFHPAPLVGYHVLQRRAAATVRALGAPGLHPFHTPPARPRGGAGLARPDGCRARWFHAARASPRQPGQTLPARHQPTRGGLLGPGARGGRLLRPQRAGRWKPARDRARPANQPWPCPCCCRRRTGSGWATEISASGATCAPPSRRKVTCWCA